jgi:hypothetical protein
MVRFSIGTVWLVVGAMVGISSLTEHAAAEDFRVDNVVYVGDEKEPASESTTIFRNGVVYDCLKSPAETVVFDRATDRFVLLNLKLRTRSELPLKQLVALVDGMQIRLAKSKDPLTKFLARPEFQPSGDDASDELVLSSPLVTYRLTLAPEGDPSVVEQYHEFCDNYARLNAVLGGRPPFGRLIVDAALAQRKSTASKVELTIIAGKEKQPTTIRSEHRVVRPLETADLDRVAKARELMDQFKLVGFDQYRKPDRR